MTFTDDPTLNKSNNDSSTLGDDQPKTRKPRAKKETADAPAVKETKKKAATAAPAETAEKPAAKPRAKKAASAETQEPAEAPKRAPRKAKTESQDAPVAQAAAPAPAPAESRGDSGDRPQVDRSGSDERPAFVRHDPPRDDRPRGDRPRFDRPRGDRPRFDRGSRPAFNRDDRPRGDRPAFNRDDRPRDDRPREEGDRPVFIRHDPPREDRPRDDRPRFDRGSRPAFNRDDRPRDDRPRDDRPRFDRGDRPAFNRDDRPRDDRPAFNRDERPAFNRDDRPRDDRPAFNRDDRSREDRPAFNRDDRPREDRPAFNRDERPAFNRDDRPREDRPAFNRDDRPRDDRPRFDKPAFNRDERPRDDRPRQDRPSFDRGDRPAFNRDDRPREERPAFNRDDRPRGDRPAFNRDDRPRGDRPRFQKDERPGMAPAAGPARPKPARPVWNQPGVFVSDAAKQQTDAAKKQAELEERPEAGVMTKAAEAYKALMGLVLEVGSEYGLTRSEDFQVEEFMVPARLQMRTTAANEDQLSGADALVRDLRNRIAEAVVAHQEFRMGAVYCFQCDSSACGHAFPEHMGDTFSGYTATGKPEWKGFANIFLEARDERVEKVYSEKPEILALVQSADELKGELLPGFGRESMVYNVLGQVVTGLVPLDFKLYSADSPRTAVTLQVVETRSLSAKHRLRLNMLGLTVDQLAKASESVKGRTAAVRLQNVLRDVRTQLEALSRHVDQLERRGEVVAPETWVAPLLRRLQGDLEKTLRTSPVRTQHAEERHMEGERPTAVALRDASKASLESFYIDVRHETTVVLGPRLRAHIFGRDGVHVTSMQLESGELERKMGKGFWIPAPGDQAVVLQAAIRAKLSE